MNEAMQMHPCETRARFRQRRTVAYLRFHELQQLGDGQQEVALEAENITEIFTGADFGSLSKQDWPDGAEGFVQRGQHLRGHATNVLGALRKKATRTCRSYTSA
ncbi:hypothetical protein HPB48_018027 [Haemaphysalis longicornis]|uniref:Uncharacterized protein n=1 Tax=Haemaphysalis longicornis TaxID=44386 RepID=A0A9J6FHT4_HAELO|nr:hypothetical protein HPB48_018027 [Haemaphysalis longicornis]